MSVSDTVDAHARITAKIISTFATGVNFTRILSPSEIDVIKNISLEFTHQLHSDIKLNALLFYIHIFLKEAFHMRTVERNNSVSNIKLFEINLRESMLIMMALVRRNMSNMDFTIRFEKISDIPLTRPSPAMSARINKQLRENALAAYNQ